MCKLVHPRTRDPLDPRALEAFDAGGRHLRDGRQAAARAAFRAACFGAPTWAAAWASLGRACAQAHDWRGAIAACLVAVELEGDGAGPGAFGTVGLAATMLHDWARARWAWRELGWCIAEGTGPIEGDFGLASVSVQHGTAHVVCRLSDPVRAQIVGVPPGSTGRRYGDQVLLDIEPFHGWRPRVELRPVREELLLLDASPYQTWEVDVRAPTREDLAELRAQSATVDVHVDDWSSGPSVPSNGPWVAERTLGVAARESQALRILASWERAGSGRVAHPPRRVEIEVDVLS